MAEHTVTIRRDERGRAGSVGGWISPVKARCTCGWRFEHVLRSVVQAAADKHTNGNAAS